jgi:hypothetical protein
LNVSSAVLILDLTLTGINLKTRKMKKIMLMLSLSCIWINMPSAGYQCFYIAQAKSENYYEPLMKAIIHYESRGNIFAFNPKELAAGPMQIRPCRIEHYNRLTGSNYTIQDCFDEELSKKVFLQFAKGKTFEQAAKNWNGSGPLTEIYWDSILVRL